MCEVISFTLEDEYKKHKDLKPSEIEKLREWLKTCKHLPEEHISGG